MHMSWRPLHGISCTRWLARARRCCALAMRLTTQNPSCRLWRYTCMVMICGGKVVIRGTKCDVVQIMVQHVYSELSAAVVVIST